MVLLWIQLQVSDIPELSEHMASDYDVGFEVYRSTKKCGYACITTFLQVY